ncbi:phosphinothricin N-acetyltransferase [Arcticibacter svalbardensis MN12-7]|uniref:Phosphinothricin N-acetyltransferase n=1 Tax=Arcticibacter svalbardensis MN12-7 TaxID=1150600 RepID=R9GX47_9SPHI|nr:GNAT family N-acetyltransferase [Arcticibacter svalbardensis]EOR96213.1 phosphinothricin N-acetyltransferase [Arcticibacter svalbardensis MN12-7]
MIIRELLVQDWPQVREIYSQGILTGNATFQKDVPTWEEWDASHLSNCRLVALKDSTITGWAVLSPVSSRCVYAGVAEVSIYVSSAFSRQGIGKLLMNQLIADSEKHGIWTLQSGIFPENTASIALHKKTGFREVGYREKIGQMNGVWRNSMLLERRSQTVFI